MSGLHEILNVISFGAWQEVKWCLNAIEEFNYVIGRLKAIHTEAEFETLMEEIQDNWRDADQREKLMSLWAYQFEGDIEKAIAEVEKWVSYKIVEIQRIVGDDKLEAFNEAYELYLGGCYNLLKTDAILKVDRIVSKDYDSAQAEERESVEKMKEMFSKAISINLDEKDTAELRLTILRRKKNGLVEQGSGYINFDYDKGYAMLNAKEIHCITLADSEECFSQLRELNRHRSTTSYSERQITNASFGSLNGHVVNLEIDKE